LTWKRTPESGNHVPWRDGQWRLLQGQRFNVEKPSDPENALKPVTCLEMVHFRPICVPGQATFLVVSKREFFFEYNFYVR
jgi:hypothetical protein